MKLTFVCMNCRNTVTESIDYETSLYVKYNGTSGLCCNTCCGKAAEYYDSQAYLMFEDSEDE